MLLIKRYMNFFDVFKGEGWENHTRFQLQGKNINFITGKTLTRDEFLSVKKEIYNVHSSRKG